MKIMVAASPAFCIGLSACYHSEELLRPIGKVVKFEMAPNFPPVKLHYVDLKAGQQANIWDS